MMACTAHDLFLLINESAAVQQYITHMCADLMYLINAMALDQCCAKSYSASNAMPMPWDFLFEVQSLLFAKETPSTKDSGAVCNGDILTVFHHGNVRERCYQFFTILCRDKQNRILRWLLNACEYPACINPNEVAAIKGHADAPGGFTAHDAVQVKKRALCVSRRRQRTRRAQKDASQPCYLLDASAVVPALSVRELALFGGDVTYAGKLPWITGRQRWVLPDAVAAALTANDASRKLISGLSGHTESMIVFGRLFKHFDIKMVALVCVLWLVPCEHHSVYEILFTAKLHGLNYALHEDPVQFCLKLLQRV